MRAARLALCALLALGAAACSKQPAAVEPAPTANLAPAALAPPAPAATAAQREEVGLAPSAGNKTVRPNEDGSETIEDPNGDSGSHNPLLAAVASTMTAATASAKAATTTAPTAWQEGVNYTRLVPAQPTAATAGQVEVLEFFWYGCPHCYAIDPLVETWKKSKPAYVVFSRVPVMWSEGHRSTARLYYTLENLGKLEALHAEVFKAIHVNGNPLIAKDPNDGAGAERIQTEFVKKLGISEDSFKKTYRSFAVETAMQRADQLVLRYRIEGVPTFVVNGKFLADVRSAGSPERLLSLVEDLAMQEHKH